VKKTTSLNKAKRIARLASEKKGEDVLLMDMKDISAMCDWFVLVSANSSRMINAISRFIQKELSNESIKPLHVEGRLNHLWVLLDYEDVVVHIFDKQIRDFYGLEQLWTGAPKKRFGSKCLTKTSRKS